MIQAGGLGVSLAGVLKFRQKAFHAYGCLGVCRTYAGLLVTDPQTGLTQKMRRQTND